MQQQSRCRLALPDCCDAQCRRSMTVRKSSGRSTRRKHKREFFVRTRIDACTINKMRVKPRALGLHGGYIRSDYISFFCLCIYGLKYIIFLFVSSPQPTRCRPEDQPCGAQSPSSFSRASCDLR
jgi:hypothetical protein